MTGALVQVRKEARALAVWWLGVAAALLATALLARRNAAFPNFRNDLELWVAMVHALGVLSLAAVSIGQELTHGTLPALLVQPTSRARLLFLKLVVLIPAVLALGVLAHELFLDRYLNQGFALRRLLVWGPVAAAIGLVPVLTVFTRKPLGGIVFAIAIPGLIVVASERFYSIRDGLQTWYIAWYGTLILSSIGVLTLFRQFVSMEIAGDGSERVSSRASASVVHGGTRARSWIWLSVKKELRLQQLTLTVSGLYVLASAAVMIAQHYDPLYVGPTFYALAGLHGVFIAIVAGAVSIAEERRMGTLASQLLQPRAAWRQWALKSGVTIGVATALAIGLPLFLAFIHRPTDTFPFDIEAVFGVVVITCAAMYVSSLSANGLWALLASFPAIGFAYLVGDGVLLTTFRTVRNWFPVDFRTIWNTSLSLAADPAAHRAWADRLRWIRELNDLVFPVLFAGAGLLVLYFTARNVRSLDRNVRTIANQVAALALYAWASGLIAFAIYRLSWASVG